MTAINLYGTGVIIVSVSIGFLVCVSMGFLVLGVGLLIASLFAYLHGSLK